FLNGLMVGAAALGTSVAVRPLRTWDQVAAANTSPASRSLSIGYRTIDVMGRSAQVFGLVRPDGRTGLEVEAGTDFELSLSSAIDEPTLIHW
ncbi:copper oxidase, partial [Rhizobium ruizarguesonis]